MPTPPAESVTTNPPAAGWWRLHRHRVYGVLGLLLGIWLCRRKPAGANWWRLHRHQVYGIVGLLLGIWLCNGCGADDQPQQQPRPACSAPGTPSVKPLPTPAASSTW